MSGQAPNSDVTLRLLEQAGRGDAAARDALFARHREGVRRVVAARLDRRVSARVDPSDVVQEVLLAAARQFADYARQQNLSFRLWLRLTALERIIQLHRFHLGAACRTVGREVPLADHSALLLAGELADTAPRPDVELERRETVGRVRRAIERLPEDDREVLMLRQYEGLDNAEAAAALGITPGAASKRFGRALRRLHELLRRGDDGVDGKPGG